LQDPKAFQLFHASSPHLLFSLLRNILANISTQRRPITATPAVLTGSSGNIEIVTEGLHRNSAEIEVFEITDETAHPPNRACVLFPDCF
jgi:hypothetical protein